MYQESSHQTVLIKVSLPICITNPSLCISKTWRSLQLILTFDTIHSLKDDGIIFSLGNNNPNVIVIVEILKDAPLLEGQFKLLRSP